MPVKKRIALGIAYDGAKYHGWQAQSGLKTIQATVEAALSFVANEKITVCCAGRTDAGVHATAQTVHFDTEAERTERAWVFGANSNLPHDISVLWAKPVSDSFHARFSARARRYRYIIYNHSVCPAILREEVTWCYRPIDEKRMQAAADYLIGEHDFSSFRGADCQSKHAVRTIHQIHVSRRQRMVIIEIQANAFLKHMVRNIVGALVEVGYGDQPPNWIKTILTAKDRRSAGVTLQPNGLYLVEVSYPPSFHLPQEPLGPFFL